MSFPTRSLRGGNPPITSSFEVTGAGSRGEYERERGGNGDIKFLKKMDISFNKVIEKLTLWLRLGMD